MGRWTVDYYDDVLGVKLKRLVSGAVKRSNLEKGEPTITYQAFIEELDEGDSFTGALFELLVKEVAERRARNPFNRHLIAEATAISLRALAVPSRIHHDRARIYRRRPRNYTLSEYLAGAPEEITVQDEGDEFDTLLDNGASAVEGSRVNTELNEAYAPAAVYSSYEPIFPPLSRRPHSSQSNTAASTIGDDNSERIFPETLLSRSPPSLYSQVRTESQTSGYTRPSVSVSQSSGLNRQPSIRRPLRPARTTDFSDFTSRRRSSHRRNSLEAADYPRLPPTEQPSFSQARRFFPSTRPRRQEISGPFPWQFDPADSAGESSPSSQPEATHRSHGSLSFTPSLTLPSIESYQSIPPDPSTSHSERFPFPRLRRGGVRPPESMLSHQISPGFGEEMSDHADIAVDHVTTVEAAEEETFPSEPEDGRGQHTHLHDQVGSLHPSRLLARQEDSAPFI